MENSSNIQSQVHNLYQGTWGFVSLMILSIIGDILLLFIIKRTRTLKSYTGDLLMSQVSSCIPRQLCTIVLIFTFNSVQEEDSLHAARYALGLLLNGFRAITSHTLAAICLNLYFAVCHSQLYRTRMSRVYVLVFIPLCWIIDISVGICPLASKDSIVSNGIALAPSYEGSAFWFWMFIVTFVYIIPASVTAFAFIKIWSHSRKVCPGTTVNMHLNDKYLLSKVVTGHATCYITLWSLLHLLLTLRAKYEQEEAVLRILATIPYVLNLLYDALKLGVYLLVYKPIRLTVLELGRNMKRKLSPAPLNENGSTSQV